MSDRSRRIAGIDEVRPGDHLCWAYADDASFEHTLPRFVRDGLVAGQRVACFLPSDGVERARALLEPSFREAVAAGALLIGSTEDAYLPDGVFDPDLRLEAYEAMVHLALADGFDALRVFGEATVVLDDAAARERWPGYELRADLLAARLPLIALCGYDVRACDPGALALLRAVHASSYGNGEADPPFHLFAGARGSLTVDGEIDFCSSELLERVTRDAAPDVSERVLDLTDLRFVDVAGIRAMARGMQAIASADAPVKVRGAGPMFRRMWQLLAFDRQIDAEFEPV